MDQKDKIPQIYWTDLSFEEQLEGSTLSTQARLFLSQMELLPLLFAEKEDYIWVSSQPEPAYIKKIKHSFLDAPKIITDLQQAPKSSSLITWGGSKKGKEIADQYGLKYPFPKIEIIQKVHSKIFSFHHTEKLPSSQLCDSEKSLLKAIQSHTKDFVVKKAFGCASRGMELNPKTIKSWMKKELITRPLIVEPWIDRVLDFSTQWYIDSDQTICYLGACRMINSPKGQYIGTFVGDLSLIFRKEILFLESHKQSAEKFLRKVAEEGYFGYVGVDAFIYEDHGVKKLHPILEINCRMTMSLVALKVLKKYFFNQTIYLHFTNQNGLLPHKIHHHTCKKNLTIDCISPDLYSSYLKAHASKKQRKTLDSNF